MGICHGRNISMDEFLEHPCPICYEKINLNYHNGYKFRNLTTPCCRQSLHQTCWEKSINQYGRCPLCCQNIVPEEFMKTIRFSVQYNLNAGMNLNDALSHTCCFAKCHQRDQQIMNSCFLGDIVCFTDDMYWNHTPQNVLDESNQ